MSVTFSTDDYQVPQWSSQPRYAFHLQIIKQGSIVGNLSLKPKPFLLIGRVADLCDLCIDNPSVSRKHAILQFKQGQDSPFLYDLGGTHGTIVNRNKLPPRAYQKVRPFDMIKFGLSSRYYILRCPELQLQQRQNADEADNKFQQLLAEKNKELSKQQLKDQYIQLLENDPYFKANNLSKKLDGSAANRQVNGVDWGISDEYDVYAYRSENQFQLEPDILRRLPRLDQNALNRITEFQTQLRKYEEIEGELNELASKEKREFGLEEKLREKKEKLEKRFVEAVEALEKAEDWIRVNIFGELETKVAKKQRLEKEDDTFEDDEFFDRTIADKRNKKQAQEAGNKKESSQIFTTQDFWKLQKQLRSELRQLMQLEKQQQQFVSQNNHNGIQQQQHDDLDAYMKQNNQNLQNQQKVINNSRLKNSQLKLNEIRNYLIPLIGEAEVNKIEDEERGIKKEAQLTQQQKSRRKAQENQRKITQVLNKLQVIREQEQQIDEQDVKIFEYYNQKGQQEEDQYGETLNYKRQRPKQTSNEEISYQKPAVKMYPNLKQDRHRDKNEQEQDDDQYIDLTKYK